MTCLKMRAASVHTELVEHCFFLSLSLSHWSLVVVVVVAIVKMKFIWAKTTIRINVETFHVKEYKKVVST